MSLKPTSAAQTSPAAVFAAKVANLEAKPAANANAVKVTPGHGVAGRHATRALLDILSGNKDPGMFGRMFPKLAPLNVPDSKLETLSKAMVDKDPTAETGDNKQIPRGFTFFGQFVDHDVTLDLTSLGDKEKDPLGIENFRTPGVDLDCVYGLGPDGSPHLYARNPANGNKPGPKMLIGKNITVPFGNVVGDFRNDLPRSPEGFALIGDHRNDENLLIAQTHLAFLKFHNKVCDMLSAGANPPADIFREARRIVTWHYQWIVLHDWVERLAGKGTVAKILHDGRKFYRFKKVPFMPVEFSAAAYRLGHSMVRQGYGHNRIFPGTPFQLFFDFSGLSGGIVGDLAPNPPIGQIPVAALPSNGIIDWRRFYALGDSGGAAVPMSPSRKLDTQLAEVLHALPGGGGNLAFRNLKRGVNLGLPSGQDVAKHMRMKDPLTPDEIASDSNGSTDGAICKQLGLHTATPLWYYILKEAKVRHDGLRLGPLGSIIVAEVFVGLIHGDQNSFLWKAKNWKPTLPSAKPGDFTMVDMLRFVNDINPIGD
ncbi:peroxidase family protein [Mesorhizobium sp. L-8-3]|uniref:peroxidase family protein n=1 Tax=Mesorhizobium sp. L-8-3 TaxID=2744522 RepID=UPI0019293810|nr:heme peroxidase family protein [Mesorhizobium sp. L-8-3]BCH21116.1 myeloperoxidase [Mesorhizobium sp. L-8-3]